MNVVSRRFLPATPLLAAILLVAGERSASAQNTYADAPFNQGSLFYRPSGRNNPAKAPTIRQVVPTTPMTSVATAPRQVRVYRPMAPRVQPRRRFGLFRRPR